MLMSVLMPVILICGAVGGDVHDGCSPVVERVQYQQQWPPPPSYPPPTAQYPSYPPVAPPPPGPPPQYRSAGPAAGGPSAAACNQYGDPGARNACLANLAASGQQQYPSAPQYPGGAPGVAQQNGGQGAAPSQPGQMSDAEARFRLMLLQKSLQFGGIFGGPNGIISGFMKGNGSSNSSCTGYTEYAAQRACENGDTWAADRIENHQSSGSEYDWYNR